VFTAGATIFYFNEIHVFLISNPAFDLLGKCLKIALTVIGKNGSEGPKKEDLQKMEKGIPQVFIQSTSESIFNFLRISARI